MYTLLCLLLVACGGTSAPAGFVDTPAVDAARLSLSLSALAHGTAADPVGTYAEALEAFEAVEPSLRQRVPAEDVLDLEYRFARLRVALEHGDDGVAQAGALSHALRAHLSGPGPLASR